MVTFTEATTLTETLDAAKVLVGQIGEGKLGSGLDVNAGYISATLSPYYYSKAVEAHAAIISEAAKVLDGAKFDANRHLNRAKTKGYPATDWATLRGHIGKVRVYLKYLIPHEHDFFKGEVRNGKPRWRCGSCRELLTVTESRKLGLLPPLVRGKK